jgi:outer membrane receptor protein involved in Fe transport
MHTTRQILIQGWAVFGLSAMLPAQQPAPDTAQRVVRVEEITVTAAPARRHEAAASLSIPRLLLRAAPALNPYDRLRMVAGLEVHDQGQGPGFASNASLRGFSSDHSTDVALWIDGVPVNEPVNGHAEGYNDWSLMFPQAIQSIEVFKGPTNPLYGNFAMAGALHVRTLERTRGTVADLQAGAYGKVEAAVLSGWDHVGSGGVAALRGVREDGWRPNAGYQLGQGHFRIVRDVSPATSVDAGVELYTAGWDSPGFLTSEEFAARAYDHVSNRTDGGFKRRAQERVSLRVLAGSALWRSTLYSTQGRWQLFLTTPPEGGTTEGSGSQLEEEDRRYGFGGTTALTWAGTRGELTVGAESRWDHSDYENWFVTSRARDSAQDLVAAGQASGALFVRSSVELLPWVRLDAGGRFDVRNARVTPDGGAPASDTRSLVSPKLGVLVQVPDAIDLYASAARGFRQTDGVIRDPTLPFITAWSYEAGAKLDRRSFSATAAAFRMDVSDEQTFDPISATVTSGGRSRRQGLELGLDAQVIPELQVRGEWTFLDAKYRKLVTEEGDTLSGARVFNTARYIGALMISVGPAGGRWQLTPAVNVVGPYSPFDEPGVTEPAYALLHVSAAASVGRASIHVGLRNVLDRAYPELRAGGFVVPGQPRTVFVGVNYRFGSTAAAR